MSGEPFAKVWGTIRKSSVWLESHHVFKLWIFMLLDADKEGFVEGSKYAIGHAANLTREETDEAFARLEAPDPDSKSRELDGRRIVPVDDGWVVVNKSKYRELRTPEQVATAERVRRHREKKAAAEPDVTGNGGNSYPTSTSTSDSVFQEEGVRGKEGTVPSLYDYCTRLAVAANKGLGTDPPRILASSGSTLQVAEILAGADIPVEFAEQAVLDAATRCKRKSDVRALGYFTRAIVEAWERQGLAEQVKDSKLRATAERTRAPQPLAALVVNAVPERPDVRVCPYCQRMLVESEWEQHYARAHSTRALVPFTDAEKS